MQKTKARKCPTCGRKLSTGNSPKQPMQLDTRLKRATSSLVTTLKLIEDQRGKTAAKAALQKLLDKLNLD